MSVSQVAFQSPVDIGPPVTPAQPPDELVKLCEPCWRAHYSALRDDGSDWDQIHDHVQLNVARTETQTLPSDEWPNLPRLLSSAQAGCGFCAFLREAILSDRFNDAWTYSTEGGITKADRKEFDIDFYYAREIVPSWFTDERVRDLRYLIIKVTFNRGISVYLHFDIEGITDCQAVAKWLVLGPPTKRNHDNDEITSFLRTEMRKLRPFSGGNYRSSLIFLPERLIDVEASSLRLVERHGVVASSAKRPQYSALSYCWGPREDAVSQTKSTRDNVQSHYESLDFDTLSPVIKDAVETTRRLSIPYLWVDSLCILQDDYSDWQEQCSQMNNIYGQAHVTLIAASSRTCKQGFFKPKRHELRLPYQSARRPDIKGSFMINFTHAFGDVKLMLNLDLTNDLHYDLTFSQWARRGWTFQEDAMAGARIVFGALNVYFGWNNEYVSKDGAAGFVAPSSWHLRHKQLHRAWEDVLRRYSAFTTSSFTNPTDVLPALSGLARKFGSRLSGEYVAGHWKNRLHRTLLWVDDSHKARPSLDAIIKRPGQKPYLVPTWSCLARGRVAWVLEDDVRSCQSEIVHTGFYVHRVGYDPYGALKDASLTLEAHVLDLASLSWSESPSRLVGSTDGHTGEIWFEAGDFYPSLSRYNESTIFDPNSMKGQSDGYYHYFMRLDFQLEPTYHSSLGKIRCSVDQLISRATLLLVGCEEEYEDREEDEQKVLKDRQGYGLVLVPLEAESDSFFVRAGIFFPNRHGQQDNLPCLKGMMKKETVRIF